MCDTKIMRHSSDDLIKESDLNMERQMCRKEEEILEDNEMVGNWSMEHYIKELSIDTCRT